MIIISQVKKQGTKKKKLRLDGKFWSRVLVIILALSMLVSVFYYLLVFTFASEKAKAAETDDGILLRIAVISGSSAAIDCKITADAGFSLGYTDGKTTYTELFTHSATTLHVARIRNLTYDGSRYQQTAEGENADVGSYSLSFPLDKEHTEEESKAALVEALGVSAYPYHKGTAGEVEYYGSFATKTDAEKHLSDSISAWQTAHETTAPETDIPETTEQTAAADTDGNTDTAAESGSDPVPDSETVSGTVSDTVTDTGSETPVSSEEEPSSEPKDTEPPVEDVRWVLEMLQKGSVIPPTETGVLVLDPTDHSIVLRYDCPDKSRYFAMAAIQAGGDERTYICAYKGTTKYKYDYWLECSPYDTDEYYGIKVINILPVEVYICGVVPYEIGNLWPLETQKAFSIAARSYAIANLGRHKTSLNADLCCGTDCQVYKGFGSTNSLVRQAVSETKGLIATWNGSICTTAYSSSTGGCTANASDVWGSNMKYYGYLKAIATPWEKYENYGNGSWTSEATGKQLFDRLKTKGYTGLTSDVTKLEILQLGTDSSYVYSVKFSDKAGHTVTVTRGDKVKSLLSPYLNSGNFVVGKAGTTVTRRSFTMLGFGGVNPNDTVGVEVKGDPGDYHVTGRRLFNVLTADGVADLYDSTKEYVMTADGVRSYNMSTSLDSQHYPTVIGLNKALLPAVLELDGITTTETIPLSGTSGSFVFVGRGWGHGVGLSQFGIKDLGDLGYDFETIFKTYYTDAKIVSYSSYVK